MLLRLNEMLALNIKIKLELLIIRKDFNTAKFNPETGQKLS